MREVHKFGQYLLRHLAFAGVLFCTPAIAYALSCPDISIAKTQPIAGFERWGDNPFWSRFGLLGWSYESEHEQRYARLSAHNYLAASSRFGLASDWQGYDALQFRARAVSELEQALNVEIHDQATHDYWSRSNSYFDVGPQWKTYTLDLHSFVGEKSVIGERRRLDLSQIKRLVFSTHAAQAAVDIDDVKLIQFAPYENSFPGLHRFDFGTDSTPEMLGWTAVTADDVYSEEKGYGFSQPLSGYGPRKTDDRRHPTALLRDWVDVADSQFQVQLPNGKYTVWLMLEDPGYWEYFPSRPKLSIEAEGFRLYQENRAASDFWKAYYANEDHSDRAGDDPFLGYIKPRYRPLILQVPVSDGRLDLNFQALPGTATLSALAIYPQAQSQQGTAFIAETWLRMQAEYCAAHQQLPGWGNGEPGKTALLERLDLDDLQTLDPALPIILASNENNAQLLRLRPGESKADIVVTLSGKTAGIKLSEVAPKFRRIAMDGSSYRSEPWLIKPMPSALSGKQEHFLLLEINGAKYKNGGVKIHVQQKNDTSTFSLPIEFHNIALPELSLKAGFLGSVALYPHAPYREIAERRHRDSLQSLQIMRAHGMTATSGGQGGPSYAAGRVQMDTAYASLAAYAKTFNTAPLSYMGLEIQNLPAENADDYGSAVAQAVKAMGSSTTQLKMPSIYWTIADEPKDASELNQVLNRARAYRQAGGRTQAFTSFYRGDDTMAAIAGKVDLVLLNLHAEPALKWLKKNDTECGLYNQHGRFNRGVYLYRLTQRYGCEHYYQFAWSSVGADPYYALDAREDDIAAVISSSRGLVRSLALVRLQQAFNDYRYLQLLQTQHGIQAKTLMRSTLAESSPAKPDDAWTPEQFSSLRQSIMTITQSAPKAP